LFPTSPFHDLILFQVLSLLCCHWDWSNGFFPDHLSMKGRGGKVLSMGTQWETEKLAYLPHITVGLIRQFCLITYLRIHVW